MIETYSVTIMFASARYSANMDVCGEFKYRKLNKMCSGNLYPFSPESIVEQIHALAMEADLVIRYKLSPSFFKIVNTDHLEAPLP